MYSSHFTDCNQCHKLGWFPGLKYVRAKLCVMSHAVWTSSFEAQSHPQEFSLFIFCVIATASVLTFSEYELLIDAFKRHSILKRNFLHGFYNLYWNTYFFQHQNFSLVMADFCQCYLRFWSKILILPCSFLLLPYSFFKFLMMALSFWSNVVLIFMLYSEHPFCCSHVIKSSCKNNIFHTVSHKDFIFCQVELQHTQWQNTFLSETKKGVIRNSLYRQIGELFSCTLQQCTVSVD